MNSLLQKVGPDRLGAIGAALLEVRKHDQYLHWDELLYRKPPDALSLEEWWLTIKLSRQGLFRPWPLKDKEGRSFVFGVPDLALEQLHHIDQDAAGHIGMPEKVLSPGIRDRYVFHSLVEEAITSSQLEGAATTRRVAKQMIRTGRPPRDTSERMILNNYRTMQRIIELRQTDLAPETVLELHRIATADTLNPGEVGRLRRQEESVDVADVFGNVLHVPPPAEQLPERLRALCLFANGRTPDSFIHPVIRAILLHFWLAYDHPFVDGNGRCARALFYWCMLRQGYWLAEFISISEIIKKAPAQYGTAYLHTETDENDCTYFILYHLNVIRRAVEQLHSYMARKMESVKQVEHVLHNAAAFNHRQLALLSHAIRHSDARYSAISHRTSHGISDQTARNDLHGLAEKGLLIPTKSGRTTWFVPVADLQNRLAEVP